MKSSYKLFSIIWDHKEQADDSRLVEVPFSNSVDYKETFCLFDITGDYRSVNFSELLSVEETERWDSICCRLGRFSKVAVVMDYIVSSKSEVSVTLYLKRFRQIVFALQKRLPSSEIVIQVPDEMIEHWKALFPQGDYRITGAS